MMDRHMEDDSSTFLQWAMNHLQHPAAATAVSAAYQQQDGGAGVGVRISGGAGDQEDSAAAFPSLQALRASQPQAVPGSVRVRNLTVQVADYGLTNSSSSGIVAGAGAGPHHRRETAQGEDQPALYRALHRHPRPQKDGQGDHPWGRGEVREGAAGEGEGARGGRRRRWQRRHPVGGARQEAAAAGGRRHGEQPWR
ncbi:Transcription factor bHLH28 [Zea mays]|uniref:Transcription factor bHLH28 n=1 Tax=Zea mays TaxID=4577 RepID=A0A1D6KGR8_MAIZE|nr:Transcription factor bHLH28 [Zea mays]